MAERHSRGSQVRVVAGKLGGRNFASPRGHRTRPMSEKVRGALFNTLGDISGLSVLDAFAGSGGLAIEAISRGAGSVTAIDSDKSAQTVMSTNFSELGILHQAKLVRASANAWLQTASETFDIVLCDPPYDNVQPNLLEKLAARANPGGLVVLSLPPAASFKLSGRGYELLSQKSYGDATLSYYRRQGL